jgi:hypothetical protein
VCKSLPIYIYIYIYGKFFLWWDPTLLHRYDRRPCNIKVYVQYKKTLQTVYCYSRKLQHQCADCSDALLQARVGTARTSMVKQSSFSWQHRSITCLWLQDGLKYTYYSWRIIWEVPLKINSSVNKPDIGKRVYFMCDFDASLSCRIH